MHIRSLVGKATQLCNSSPKLWSRFIRGWLQRQQQGVVPYLMPEAKKLLFLPKQYGYGSYAFFSETRQGRKELAFFLQKLKSGDVVYDIGSYRGVYAVASKLKLGDAVTVHAFEPVAGNIECIERICTLNKFSGVNVVPMAVGEGGCVSGHVNSRDGVLRLCDSTTNKEARFKTVSLDDYISNGAPPRQF